jgi:hypothetical protein
VVKIVINIRDGLLDLDADPQQLDQATECAIRLIDRLSSSPHAPRSSLSHSPPSSSASVEPPDGAEQINGSAGATPEKSKGRKKKGVGKTKNWEYKPELLLDSDWAKVKDFVALKAPSTQNEKVAVFVSILSQLLNRKGFDGHEIHTCFKTLGERTPASLTAVLGNMATEGLGHTSDGRFQLDFAGSQLVDHDLPKAKPAKK